MKKILALGVFACALAIPLSCSAATFQDDFWFETSSCNELWETRNEVYKDAGYCFKTARAIKHFGNAGCRYDDIAKVPLSAAAKRYIAKVLRYEREYQCPK